MASPGTELASLDFGNLIGEPMVAVIKAQGIAAQSTVDFIKSVGFDKDNNPIYVDFIYPKETVPFQPAIPADPENGIDEEIPFKAAVYEDMKFSVPILTMMPIPFIKVDLFSMDFNAKITSMVSKNSKTDFSVDAKLEAKQEWLGGSAKLNVSTAYKKSTTTGSSVERTYSMAIHVQASQDEMPAGMEKLLGILEGAMKSVPVGTIDK